MLGFRIGLLEGGIVKPIGEIRKAKEAGLRFATASQNAQSSWEERNVY